MHDYEVPKPEPTDNIAYTRETVALGAGVVVGMAFVGICVLARPAMQVWRRSDLGRKTVLYKKLSTDGRRSSSEVV